MLILGVKDGESVHIGNNIVITVFGRKSGQLRIGFDAPQDVKILRESLVSECCEVIDTRGKKTQ